MERPRVGSRHFLASDGKLGLRFRHSVFDPPSAARFLSTSPRNRTESAVQQPGHHITAASHTPAEMALQNDRTLAGRSTVSSPRTPFRANVRVAEDYRPML